MEKNTWPTKTESLSIGSIFISFRIDTGAMIIGVMVAINQISRYEKN